MCTSHYIDSTDTIYTCYDSLRSIPKYENVSNRRDTEQLAGTSMIFLHDKKVKDKGQGYSKVKTKPVTCMSWTSLSFWRSRNPLKNDIDMRPWPFDLELFWFINTFMKEITTGSKSPAPSSRPLPGYATIIGFHVYTLVPKIRTKKFSLRHFMSSLQCFNAHNTWHSCNSEFFYQSNSIREEMHLKTVMFNKMFLWLNNDNSSTDNWNVALCAVCW